MRSIHFRQTGGGRVVKILAILLVAQAALVAAFVLPQHKPEPHAVPVGVVGPSSLANAIEAKQPGAFDVKLYASEADARHAIEHRQVYGALVVGRAEQHLLVASAASASVAQLLRGAFAEHASAVTDLKPLVEEDPRGATLNLVFLPLIMVCIPAVLLFSPLRLKTRGLIGGVTLFAALGGLAVVALVAEGLGALPGSYLALSGVAAVTILAIALPTAGLHRLFGHAGIALGAVLFILIANPASGNGSAPELLPDFWRQISQFMPPGAGGQSLRNTAYFDGNAIVQPLLVLSAYVVAGVMLMLAGDAVRKLRERSADDRRSVPSATDDPVYA
jgi:hypothetical protein